MGKSISWNKNKRTFGKEDLFTSPKLFQEFLVREARKQNKPVSSALLGVSKGAGIYDGVKLDYGVGPKTLKFAESLGVANRWKGEMAPLKEAVDYSNRSEEDQLLIKKNEDDIQSMFNKVELSDINLRRSLPTENSIEEIRSRKNSDKAKEIDSYIEGTFSGRKSAGVSQLPMLFEEFTKLTGLRHPKEKDIVSRFPNFFNKIISHDITSQTMLTSFGGTAFNRASIEDRNTSKKQKEFKDGGVPNRDKEMVGGIADILAMIDNVNNRKEVARKMIKDFKEEDIKFDKKQFLTKARINKLQNGGQSEKDTTSVEYIKSILEANKDKNFVQRILEPNPDLAIDYGVDDKSNSQKATHYMTYAGADDGYYVYPNVVQDKTTEKLLDLNNTGRDGKWGSFDYALDNTEFIKFNTEEEAKNFTENYKKYWDTLPKDKQGGGYKRLENYKYGGKLEEDWINEYTIDGQKAKFFGNVSGNTSVKFNRVAMIASRYNEIIDDIDEIIQEESKKTLLNPQTGNVETTPKYNLAVAFKLITQTGIRIGNEDSAEGFMSTYKEKGKEVLAHTYGLTTLLREHIRFRNDIAYLDFTGKKHVENTFIVSQKLSKLIKPIYDSKFPTVFNIDEYTLTKFIKDETSPYFSSKDFRTFRANVYANEKARHLSKPKIKKEYRDVVNEVADFVSDKLNNTPTVVKTSYIDNLLFWYYFGNPTELPSKLPDPKKKEKKENGGSISSNTIFLQRGGEQANKLKAKYNKLDVLKFQNGTAKTKPEKKIGYKDWLKAITDIDPVKDNSYNYIAAYNANISPQDVVKSYNKTLGTGTENQKTGEVLRKEGTQEFANQVDANSKVGFETYKGKDGKIYSKQTKDLNKDDSNVDEYLGTYEGETLEEVPVTSKSEHWSNYQKEYEANNPLDVEKEAEDIFYGRKNSGKMFPSTTRKGLAEDIQRDREEKSMDYVAQQLIKNNPQGDMSRAEWLNTLTPEEQDIVKRVSQNKPSIWTEAKRGIQAIGEGSSQEAVYNILNSKDYSNEEKVEMIKSYKDSPRLANILDMAKTAGIMNIPAKMVQSAYKEGYTLDDAIKGKQNNAGIIEDVVTDPLNLVGIGLWSKLSKTGKFASLANAYKAVKGLSKEQQLSKLNSIVSDLKFEPLEYGYTKMEKIGDIDELRILARKDPMTILSKLHTDDAKLLRQKGLGGNKYNNSNAEKEVSSMNDFFEKNAKEKLEQEIKELEQKLKDVKNGTDKKESPKILDSVFNSKPSSKSNTQSKIVYDKIDQNPRINQELNLETRLDIPKYSTELKPTILGDFILFPSSQKINKNTKLSKTSVTREVDSYVEKHINNPITKQKFLDYGGDEKNWSKVKDNIEFPIQQTEKTYGNHFRGIYNGARRKSYINGLEEGVGVGVHEKLGHQADIVSGKSPFFKQRLPKLVEDLKAAVDETPEESYAEIKRMFYEMGWGSEKVVTMEELNLGLEKISDAYNIGSKVKDKDLLLEIVNKAPIFLGGTYGANEAIKSNTKKEVETNKDGGIVNLVNFLKSGGSIKDSMKCEEVRKSTRKGKK